MKDVLKMIMGLEADPCVSIILNTHRTHPDHDRDPIVLKNMITEAEHRLTSDYDRKTVYTLMEKLDTLASTIDHRYNLDSLILFVSESLAEFVRLPLAVKDRVVIDKTFAIRDLVRAGLESRDYFVLTISKQKARLIQAFNDKSVREIEGEGWPILNDTLYETDKQLLTTNRSDNLTSEFFNRVDKALQQQRHNRPLPVVVVCGQSNFPVFMDVTDNPEGIAGHLLRNRDDEAAHAIVKDAWTVMQQAGQQRKTEALASIDAAMGRQQIVTELNDIHRTIREGRGAVLYVEKHFTLPTVVAADESLVPQNGSPMHGAVDDIVDHWVEEVLRFKGSVVFLPQGSLTNYHGVALQIRY